MKKDKLRLVGPHGLSIQAEVPSGVLDRLPIIKYDDMYYTYTDVDNNVVIYTVNEVITLE